MSLLRNLAACLALSCVASAELRAADLAFPQAVIQTADQDSAELDLQRHVDPFFRRPLVSSISAAERWDDFSWPPRGEGEGRPWSADDAFVVDYRFDHPARFPLPSWGACCEYGEQPGALIYEGMRLAIRPDGRYQVRFTIGTPAMPVTVQIQFELADPCTNQGYTLTLPPITIPSETKPRSATAGQLPKSVCEDLQTIHHEGYLPLFDGYHQAEPIQVVRRTGTARFGYGVRVP